MVRNKTHSAKAGLAALAIAACGGLDLGGSDGVGGDRPGSSSAASTTGSGDGLGVGGAGPIGIPDASGRGGADPDVDVLCFPRRIELPPLPVDLFFLVDQSDSMNCPASDAACRTAPTPLAPPTRWLDVTTAIEKFVTALESSRIGAGVGFFPNFGAPSTVACDAPSYAAPAVPIAPLPGNASALGAAFDSHQPLGTKPTAPALEGAITYAKSYVNSASPRAAAVVLVTDGSPDACGGTVASASEIAQAGYASIPSISTYVIGLASAEALGPVALAGSGGAHDLFPATTDPTAEVAAALTTIASLVTCDYVLPTDTFFTALDYVEIDFAGMRRAVGQVDDRTLCGSLGGWYFDQRSAPTKITFCPQTCDPLRATPGFGVNFVLGCG